MNALVRPILLILSALSPALAAQIQFTGLPEFTENAIYIGFAKATIDGIPNQLLICDDYHHTTYVPSGNLSYSVSHLIGPNPLSGARFVSPGGPGAADFFRYREAAVLLAAFATLRSPDATTVGDYQFALWHLMSPDVALTRSPAQQALLDAAAIAVQSNSPAVSALYSHLVIYTPVGASVSNQEFLHYAPEPNFTLLLLGICAVGFMGLTRRSRA